MEAIETPECRPFSWCHEHAVAICVRVDAERNFDELREEESRRESDRTGESFSPQKDLDQYRHLPKLLDVAEGLNYLHTSYTIHGDLKGAGVLYRSC